MHGLQAFHVVRIGAQLFRLGLALIHLEYWDDPGFPLSFDRAGGEGRSQTTENQYTATRPCKIQLIILIDWEIVEANWYNRTTGTFNNKMLLLLLYMTLLTGTIYWRLLDEPGFMAYIIF